MGRNLFKAFGIQCLNLFLPPLCYLCHKPLLEAQKLCGSCWAELQFVTDPFCFICGLPFEFEMGRETKCLSCLEYQYPFDLMRSVFKYDAFSKRLITRFKHGDRTELLPLFGDWLALPIKDFGQIDLIMPVPLHWRRLFKRKYNQAGLLAQELGRQLNIPYDMLSLKRIKATLPQHGNKAERFLNLEKSFAIDVKNKIKIKGKKILLVDDVVTTGATVKACSLTLKEAGAANVYILALARVPLPL